MQTRMQQLISEQLPGREGILQSQVHETAPATGETDGHAGELGERGDSAPRHGCLQAREGGK